MTWGRLGRLIRQLPRTSRTVQTAAGASARWGDTEHLLAGIYDAVVHGNWMFHRKNFTGKPRHPEPLERPGAPRGRRIGGKTSYSPHEIDRIFKRIREREAVSDGG